MSHSCDIGFGIILISGTVRLRADSWTRPGSALGANRKVLTRKLAHPVKALTKKPPSRKPTYTSPVLTALIKVCEIFDHPCGQRLAPVLREQVERFRKKGELRCIQDVAEKLRDRTSRESLLIKGYYRQLFCLFS